MRPGSLLARRVLCRSAAIVAAIAISGASAAASSTPPGTPHSEVVAQRVIELGEGAYHWSVAGVQVLPDADLTITPAGAPAFLVVDDGSLLVIHDEGDIQHLAVGQAAIVGADGSATLRALDGAPAAYFGIELVAGAPTGRPTDVGDPFTPGSGARDIELVRDVVAAGETVTIAGADTSSTLVLATSGRLTIGISGSGGTTSVGNGEARVLDGELVVTNQADGPATFVAAIIGAPVADAAPPTTAAPTATTLPPPPSRPTTTAPAIDSDNDGLSDAEETALGTDPGNPDSDGDAIDDGTEVHDTGSNPLVVDSDGDGIEDYPEVDIYNTSPSQFDTDGDGIGDGAEVFSNGTDPLNPDSDGDGLDDGTEGSIGTDPTNADSDLDGAPDGADVDPLDPTVS
jgi:hypothetical protein